MMTDQDSIDFGEQIAAAGRELFAVHLWKRRSHSAADPDDPLVHTVGNWVATNRDVERNAVDPLEEADLARFRATVLDVAEPTGAEETPGGPPSRLRRGVERSPIAISLVTPGGEFTIVNPALCAMLGRDEAAFRELTLTDVSHADDLTRDREAIARMLSGETRSYQTEKRYLWPDDQVVWTLASMLLVRNANGAPDYFVVLVHDISDRRRAEDEARARAAKWSALAELGCSVLSGTTVPLLMDEGVGVIARSLGIGCVALFAPDEPSGALVAVAGVGCQEWLDGPAHEDARSDAHARFALGLGAPLVVADLRIEKRFVPPPQLLEYGFVSGLSVVVTVRGEAHAVLIAYSTEPRRFSAEEVNFAQTVADVLATAIERMRYEERQQRDQQQERLASVGQLAAGVAHDFNNIVSAISLYAELLEARQSLDEAGRGHLSAIREQVERGTALIWQVLDFAHRSPLEPVEVDLVTLVDRLMPLLHRTMPNDVGVVVDADDGPYLAQVDPTRVQQILLNLASNAKDAFDGPGQLTITLSRGGPPGEDAKPPEDAEEGPWVRIDVADTGRGIPPEIIERVLDPFFTTKPTGEGTGLGLSQVHGLVSQHKGHVEIESSAAKGTTVTVTLPAAATVTEPVGVLPAPRGSGERLLLVDDDAAVREPLGEILEALGYAVTLVGSGEEAVAVLRVDPSAVSVVVSDILMPGMGGEDLGRIITEHWPDLPLILMSGSPTRISLADAEASTAVAPENYGGGFVRLAKPFSSTKLAEALRLVLRRPT